MYSQCPDCQTRFRVTAEVLRAAHGTVRCGRCGSAFDALERLSDTTPPAAHVTRPAQALAAAGEPAVHAEYHFSAEDLERVFIEASDWREAPPEPQAAATPEPTVADDEAPVIVDEDARVEDITLEGERIRIEAPAEEPATAIDFEGTAEREIEALAQELEAETVPVPEPPPEPVVEPSPRPSPEPAMVQVAEPAAPAPEATPALVIPAAPKAAVEPEPLPLAAQRWRRPAVDEEPEPAPSGFAWSAVAWSVGALVLAVVLAAQVTHQFRQQLARHPQIGPPLRTTYERLGLDLLPNWDLAAFELRQWGNAADAAAEGRMVVRASLTNRAGFAQPHPILRLELEDRFGAVVATRDFEPADYLKNPSQATRLIAPGSSSEAELLLAEPGRDAVGYRLDVCLRESAALLRCAGGAG